MRKIWKNFKRYIYDKFYNAAVIDFVCKGKVPKTEDEIFWYRRGLQDCVEDLRIYERTCNKKYKSVMEYLKRNGIDIVYDEITNRHYAINTIIDKKG